MESEFDCELEITSNEGDYVLETGEIPESLEKALETMIELATKRKGPVTCKFTMTFEPAPSEDN